MEEKAFLGSGFALFFFVSLKKKNVGQPFFCFFKEWEVMDMEVLKLILGGNLELVLFVRECFCVFSKKSSCTVAPVAVPAPVVYGVPNVYYGTTTVTYY